MELEEAIRVLKGVLETVKRVEREYSQPDEELLWEQGKDIDDVLQPINEIIDEIMQILEYL